MTTQRSTRPAATPTYEISGTVDWPAFPFNLRCKDRAERDRALYEALAGGKRPRIADWQWDSANWDTVYCFLRGKVYSHDELVGWSLGRIHQAVSTIEVSASMHTTDGPMILSIRHDDIMPAADADKRPVLDKQMLRVRVDGVWHDVTEKQKDMLAVLFKANGNWVGGKNIGVNAHHYRASMPKPVADMIQSHQVNGYRIPALLPH